MNDQVLAQVLTECTEQVLEQMFFVRPFGDPLLEGPLSSPHLVADVGFAGEPSGHLILSVSTQAARSIAADFLAEEEPVLSEQQVGEVVCELANIICGSVLTRIASRTLFHLGSPRLQSYDLLAELHTSAMQSLNLWNGNLTVTLRTEFPLCSAADKSGS